MPTFNIGDCVWKLNLYGDRFTVDIMSVEQDKDGTTTYHYVPNGIAWSKEPQLTFRPNAYIPFVTDPCVFKGWSETKEKMWHGTSLAYRAPEPDDDEKRALWQAKLKKHEDAIAELHQRCAPFKKGSAVSWQAVYCCNDIRFNLLNMGNTGGCNSQSTKILKGVVESEVTNDFQCTVKSPDGIVHKTTVWALYWGGMA
jgi:hypothetical protein